MIRGQEGWLMRRPVVVSVVLSSLFLIPAQVGNSSVIELA
jgi:hypothetical protein